MGKCLRYLLMVIALTVAAGVVAVNVHAYRVESRRKADNNTAIAQVQADLAMVRSLVEREDPQGNNSIARTHLSMAESHIGSAVLDNDFNGLIGLHLFDAKRELRRALHEIGLPDEPLSP